MANYLFYFCYFRVKTLEDVSPISFQWSKQLFYSSAISSKVRFWSDDVMCAAESNRVTFSVTLSLNRTFHFLTGISKMQPWPGLSLVRIIRAFHLIKSKKVFGNQRERNLHFTSDYLLQLWLKKFPGEFDLILFPLIL